MLAFKNENELDMPSNDTNALSLDVNEQRLRLLIGVCYSR